VKAGKLMKTSKYLNIILVTFSLSTLVNCFSFNSFKLLDTPVKSLELNEILISGAEKDKILVISIDGVISDRSSADTFGLSQKESMIARIKEELSKAYQDQDIKGIILKINSPGGGVTASDIIYREILLFKNNKKIPIVSLFMDTAASGGYYIAMASDKIVAHPTTITGSIGVVISGVNVKKGLEKIGIEDQTIVSGSNKNILSPLADFSKEQRVIIQSIVNDMYDRFYQIVLKGRPAISDSKLKLLADGRIFSASQAKQEGLVDEIGYFEDAIKVVITHPNYNSSSLNRNVLPRIVTYSQIKKPIRNYYQINEELNMDSGAINQLIKNINIHSEVRFLYMWML
jgi:protease IV